MSTPYCLCLDGRSRPLRDDGDNSQSQGASVSVAELRLQPVFMSLRRPVSLRVLTAPLSEHLTQQDPDRGGPSLAYLKVQGPPDSPF